MHGAGKIHFDVYMVCFLDNEPYNKDTSKLNLK